MGDVPTSAITIVEAEHGRLRRRQRGIDKKDLQSAIKYGEKYSTHPRPNGDETSLYRYKKITYIVNEVTKEEVTAYAEPLRLDPVPITDQMQLLHERAQAKIRQRNVEWNSNTVLVVDTSGSMRTADVWGTRTRLGAVWVSLALDFIAHRIESGEVLPLDVVSVVTLSAEPNVVIEESPCTWILYNKIVEIYNEELVPPCGHGPFLPSLDVAQYLLTKHENHDGCAMALIFLSDGKPSDYIKKGETKEDRLSAIAKRVESLASLFGRRLTFTAIGIGDYDAFETLETMVEAAKDFGVKSEFCLPSMTSSSLGSIFTSVATSITTTQTEMTDVSTFKQKKVRSFLRESRKKASEQLFEVSPHDFFIYPAHAVKRKIYKEWFDSEKRLHKSFEETDLQSPDAHYIALAKAAFGEGAERFAFRFFELASDRKTIVGRPLVAKESRLVLVDGGGVGDEEARKQFVRTFCSTQQLARRLADEFNKKMEETRRVSADTPLVRFLDCSIYEIVDKNTGKSSVLVEEKLDHTKWHKWNSNNGYVEGMKEVPKARHDAGYTLGGTTGVTTFNLDAIVEGSEDEEESDEEEDSPKQLVPIRFSTSEVAQAFSHFTYQATGRKRLVCDLQGVFDEKDNVLRFSDPVIHYHNPARIDRRCVHGQTDRGEKGVRQFFETHNDGHHGHLCRLVLRGFKRQTHRRTTDDHRARPRKNAYS